MILKDWSTQWRNSNQRTDNLQNYRDSRERIIIPINNQPTAKVLQLHHGLQKPESSILIQMRTHCIGLKKFLYECRVADINSPMCNCKGGEETAEHIAMLCPLESSRRNLLLDDYGRQLL